MEYYKHSETGDAYSFRVMSGRKRSKQVVEHFINQASAALKELVRAVNVLNIKR